MNRSSRIQLKGYDYFVAVNDSDLDNNIAYVLELSDQPDLDDLRVNIRKKVVPGIPMLSSVLIRRGQKPYMERISDLPLEKIAIVHEDTLTMSDLNGRIEIAGYIERPFSINQPLWRIVSLKQELSNGVIKHYLLRSTTKGEDSAEMIFRLIDIFSYLPKSIFRFISGEPPKKAFDMSYLPFFPEEISVSGCRVKDIFFHVNGHESGSCFYLSTYSGEVSLSLTSMDSSISDPEKFIRIANDCLHGTIQLPSISTEAVTTNEIMDYFER